MVPHLSDPADPSDDPDGALCRSSHRSFCRLGGRKYHGPADAPLSDPARPLAGQGNRKGLAEVAREKGDQASERHSDPRRDRDAETHQRRVALQQDRRMSRWGRSA